jgi:hypothetical protein
MRRNATAIGKTRMMTLNNADDIRVGRGERKKATTATNAAAPQAAVISS